MKRLSILFTVLLIGFAVSAQTLEVNTSKSKLKWTGKKVTGEHWGYVNLKDGSLTLENGKISGGKFNIDMNSLSCEDLESEEWNQKLIGHLKSDDFFSVDKFSTATLKIKEGSEFKEGKALVKADLTIKGITKPISFKTKKVDGAYIASISIDRTEYDVRYGSGKFFDNLGDNMIYDEFTLDVKIFTN